ncbi:acyl-CoA-like ligand-binding transcription factor [Streptomyces scabiei]|uniref:acyl-CoA-like ligand-binding transcription factor n=1 Tax=Streptomyces scabiei TaxID=1930 RepID=UPI001B312130|nr:hypothetical protein [Streptomyces sp. LBUM 1480]
MARSTGVQWISRPVASEMREAMVRKENASGPVFVHAARVGVAGERGDGDVRDVGDVDERLASLGGGQCQVSGPDRLQEDVLGEVLRDRAARRIVHCGTDSRTTVSVGDRVRDIADVLSSQPENETPWEALRHTFHVITGAWDEAPQESLRHLRMIRETPSLRARYWEKQLSWHEALLPEVSRRLSDGADGFTDPRSDALVGSTLACLDAAVAAWVACEATVPSSLLLDRAMAALTVQA